MGRQLGGSFGIAALTTFIHLRNGFHRSNLLAKINDYNSIFTQKIDMITRQTFLLTYTDAYWVVGFVIVYPFIVSSKV
jgi:DHA2 family multidrug resistance protein